ncbi:restriction endonuclease subunit S [Burkholderia vietnamiensis]|uniref:restriction endonuclease subunit S n=1 Tax=Burkholderia vietnamiensis TaxID=60552 RepID=UPI001CF12967|nr:restriction endonuclease subunit S [Burkholderia vietnamiensis]MCA8182353.1 restriction endonuclease subunit S [Burkholderia vietnamiensis]
MQSNARPLHELCSLIVDCPHSTPVWTDAGYLVIRNQNIKGGRLDLSSPSFTDAFHFAHRIRRAKPREGDIIFTREAPMGEVCMIPRGLECCVGQRQVLLRPNPTMVDGRYLLYALQSPQVQHEIGWNEGTGSTVSNVRIPVLEALRIPTPPVRVQRGIGELLGVLDDRIDLLRQTNATLESIAQTLFKSWFIDFDPVRAKAEGREPEGMDADTAALFPDSFEDSALGEIPMGWKVIPFSETVNILGGGTPKTSVSEYWGGEIPWFSVVDAPSPGQVFTISTEKNVSALGVENSSTRILPSWTTIISARGTVGKLAMTGSPMAMNQSCYGLTPKLQGAEVSVYLAAQRLVDDLKRLAHGGVFDTITRDTLATVHVCVPDDRVRLALESSVRPLFARILANVTQMETLRGVRNSLLPRLISGKIRLSVASEQAEEVTV